MRKAKNIFSCPLLQRELHTIDNASVSGARRARARCQSTVEGTERALEAGRTKDAPCRSHTVSDCNLYHNCTGTSSVYRLNINQ